MVVFLAGQFQVQSINEEIDSKQLLVD